MNEYVRFAERKPDKPGRYVVLRMGSGDVPAVMLWKCDKWSYIYDNRLQYIDSVEWWAELPRLPKETT